eukprot:jgi/Botrbrau1/14431/Bobra.0014s0077.1
MSGRPDCCLTRGMSGRPDCCLTRGMSGRPDFCLTRGMSGRPDCCLTRGMSGRPGCVVVTRRRLQTPAGSTSSRGSIQMVVPSCLSLNLPCFKQFCIITFCLWPLDSAYPHAGFMGCG